MADAYFYKTNASLKAEEEVNANKGSKRKKSKLASLLTLWVSNILILVLLIDIFYVSIRVETPPPPIVADVIVIGYGVILFIIMAVSAKDLAQEIRKLFQ